MNRVFVDMDGVIADFDGMKVKLGISGDELVELHGAFQMLEPIAGAKEALDELPQYGYDVWIATRPAPSHPMTYHDKVVWIMKHFPQLKKKVIMTQHKGLLGDRDDVLIDDRPEKAFCNLFPGKLIHFGDTAPFMSKLDDYAELPAPIDHPRMFRALDWTQAVNCLKWLAEK
jgi:5'-nucleotidase